MVFSLFFCRDSHWQIVIASEQFVTQNYLMIFWRNGFYQQLTIHKRAMQSPYD